MGHSRQQLGNDGEDVAAAYLQSKRAKILHRNWRPPRGNFRGEIDIIAEVNGYLCFVEVKTRRSNDKGSPQEAVNYFKRRQISALANYYLSQLGDADRLCRFDIVEVWLVTGQQPRVSWIENAFDYEARG